MNDSGTPPDDPAKHEAGQAAVPPRQSVRLATALAAAVFTVAAAGYAWTGSPGLMTGAPEEVARSDDTADPQQVAAAVQRLAQKLQDQPDDAEGWAMLARAYVRLEQLPEALPAFARATALREDDPQLLADYAEALFLTRSGGLEADPRKLIERALKLDPGHPKSLVLAGTVAFNAKDFAAAAGHWEKLAKLSAPNSPGLAELEEGIAQARRLANQQQPQNGVSDARSNLSASASASASASTSSPAVLRGTITLSPTIAQLAAPTDTLFVYARPAEGSRMPLAILRRQVKDLPLDFTLDDGLAMSPAARLSMHPKVIVEARISKSGQAQVSDGDLTGRSAPVGNDASRVVVEISDVAGK
ncbi:MAG: tetratricopeptide repeat protein [Methylibium sp.]